MNTTRLPWNADVWGETVSRITFGQRQLLLSVSPRTIDEGPRVHVYLTRPERGSPRTVHVGSLAPTNLVQLVRGLQFAASHLGVELPREDA